MDNSIATTSRQRLTGTDLRTRHACVYALTPKKFDLCVRRSLWLNYQEGTGRLLRHGYDDTPYYA